MPDLNLDVKLLAVFCKFPQNISIERSLRSEIQVGDTLQRLFVSSFKEKFEDRHHRRVGLACSRRRDDQDIFSLKDFRYCQVLDDTRFGNPLTFKQLLNAHLKK